MVRKYSNACCEDALSHCAFCSVLLCPAHAEDAEVEGHIFQVCEDCAAMLRDKRPGQHEHCTCHDEEYCDIHENVEGLG